jgi:hypothetical protein
VSNEQTEFAGFFEASWDPCLRAVVAVVGSPQLAEDHHLPPLKTAIELLKPGSNHCQYDRDDRPVYL